MQNASLDVTEYIVCKGVRIPSDPDVITARIARKLRSETYESHEVNGLSRFVRPDDRVLELGAGIGFISSFLAVKMRVRHITCVEANQRLCEFAAKVHAANGVECADVQNAVVCSDSQMLGCGAKVPFFVTDPFWSSSLSRPTEGHYDVVDVPQVSLSELVAVKCPTVVVADIEGGEETLFEDADLTGVRCVFMELHTRLYGGRGIMKVFQHMHQQGFFYHQRVSAGGAVLFKRV